MPVNIEAPAEGASFDLGKMIEFAGTASPEVVKVQLSAPFGSDVIHLANVPVVGGAWRFRRKFSGSGPRKVLARGLDAAGKPMSSESDSVGFRVKTAFRKPLNGAVVTSRFGPRPPGFHHGIDLGGLPVGSPVMAVADGVVTDVETGCGVGNHACGGGFGNLVIVKHVALGFETLYAHLSGVSVTIGQKVQQGTVLGKLGETGHAFGPHLHMELRRLSDRVTVNPELHIKPIV